MFFYKRTERCEAEALVERYAQLGRHLREEGAAFFAGGFKHVKPEILIGMGSGMIDLIGPAVAVPLNGVKLKALPQLHEIAESFEAHVSLLQKITENDYHVVGSQR